MNNNTTTNNDTTAATTEEESTLATVRRCRASQDKKTYGVGRRMSDRLSALRSKMTATLVLFFCAVWNVAQAADVQFIIVNNKGKQAFNYTLSTPSTYAVDAKARSIFAENFRFYTSLEGAVADAGGSPEGTSLSGSGPFYVRYDAKSTRVGSNSSKKYLIRCRNRAGLWWYIYFDNSDRKLKMTTQLEGGSDIEQFLWQFDDGGDPYDVYITSDYADATVSGGAVSVSAVSTSNKVPYVTYQAQIASGSYDQSAKSGFTMQSFFFTQGTNTSTYNYGSEWSSIWSNSVQLVGAYNGITYNYRNGYNNSSSGFEDKMPYYLCANGNPNASGAMSNGYQWHCFRSWRCEDTSTNNVSQIQVVSDFALFHVVNKSGDIAISKLDETPSSTLTLPTDIKSPYIDNSNYKFFNTKEEAAAYSSATTLGERETAAAAAITTLAEVTNNTVYVGYYYDKSAKPAELPALDGSSWYRILDRYGNADNYMYSKLNNNGRADNSSICNSTTEMTGSFTDDYHLWKLTGDDPYAIYLSNKWMNENKGSDSDMPIRYGGISQGWFRPMSGYYTTGYTMMLLGYDATYVNMAVVSEAYRISDYEYLYFFGANGSNGSTNVQFMRNQNTTSNLYKTDRAAAALLKFIEIPSFTYHVTTPSGTELTCKVSYDLSTVTDLSMPTELQRKYISSYTFHPTQADAEEGTNAMTTCEEAIAACTHDSDGYHIYVKYTVDTANLPFTISTDYAHATWYRMKAESSANPGVYAYTRLSDSHADYGIGVLEAADALESQYYTHSFQYAFFGDPYELRVMNREAGNGVWLGVPAGAANLTPITSQTEGNMVTWEICDNTPLSDNGMTAGAGEFVLRAFGTEANPIYAGFANGHALYYTIPMGLQVTPLPERTYNIHFVDNSSRIAISKSGVTAPVEMALTYDLLKDVAPAIVSPYIQGETLTGYTSAVESGTLGSRKTYNIFGAVTELPFVATDPVGGTDIYIRYTTDHLMEKFLHLRGRRTFNVRVNGDYIYADGSSVLHKASPTESELEQHKYLWYFIGEDPYAVEVKDAGTDKYLVHPVSAGVASAGAVSLGEESAPSHFIMMSGSAEGNASQEQIELVAACGNDVSTAMFSIGRSDDLQSYSNATYAKGSPELQWLITLSRVPTRYHIIDRSGKIIIEADDDSGELRVPTEWQSPLVSQYHFYQLSDFDVDVDTYTLKGGATELLNPVDAPVEGGRGQVYVTYDVRNESMFSKRNATTGVAERADGGGGAPPTYLLKFLRGQSIHQEDGKDGIIADKKPAFYPYNNGDANLYIYGEEQWQAQTSAAAATRTRWLWYVESRTMDPYHVKLSSYQTQTTTTEGSTTKNHHAYLRTYVPKTDNAGTTSYGQIVTGVVTDNPEAVTAGALPTEYMILGTAGHGRLVTVDKVAIDLNSDGDTDDEGENERRQVKSFEQYWKNSPTGQNVITKASLTRVTGEDDITKTNDENPHPTGAQRTALAAETTKKDAWHAYYAWANSAPWDYRVVDGKHVTSKYFAYREHWFQTVNMWVNNENETDAGTFTLVETDLDPAMVLLDLHGWEVMRKTLPAKLDGSQSSRLDAIAPYNSPMVKTYHFWVNAEKVANFRRYVVKEPLTVGGVPYTSNSLTSLPTSADNTTDANGRLVDLYVTYDVDSLYARTYSLSADDVSMSGNEAVIKDGVTPASTFIIRQDGRALTTANGSSLSFKDIPTSYAAAVADRNSLWYLRPNFNIDREMGIKYLGEEGAPDDAHSKTRADREAELFAAGKNGFDPYNLQIQSVAYPSRYVTSSATSATLTDGAWTGSGGTLSLQAQTVRFTPVGYDQVYHNVTNATFMAVQDANGNLRLMPRFDQTHVVYLFATLETPEAAVAAGTETGGQTTMLALPAKYTYHIVNKSAKVAQTYVETSYNNFFPTYPDAVHAPYKPAIPAELKAYGATNFRYYDVASLDAESYARKVYRLSSYPLPVPLSKYAARGGEADLYVFYDVNETEITSKGFDGSKMYNASFADAANYLIYNSGSMGQTASLTDAKNADNIWRFVANGGDPYDVRLYSFRNGDVAMGVSAYDAVPTTTGTQTRQTFIITEQNASADRFRLQLTNSNSYESTGTNQWAYLQADGTAAVKVSQSAAASVKLHSVSLDITYKLYDLSGMLALQGTVTDVTDVAPSLPDFMRSPLVKQYYYWQDEHMSKPITTLSGVVDNTVYVSYLPYTPEEVALKLDGSALYTMHTKSLPETLFCPTSPIVAPTYVSRRDNYYELQLLGRTINGQYDPYDVAVYSPSQNRYWGGNVWNDKNNRTGGIRWDQTNAYKRFAILDGSAAEGIDYVQMVQRKVNGSTYYPDHTDAFTYLYVNASNELCDGQGTGYSHLANDSQLHCFQQAYVYHVLNMSGNEAVSAIEPRIVKPDITAPVLPEVVQSPVVKRYHFYDVSSFDVSGDGVYTLKIGAKELSHVSDATTQDIYVVYTAADLDRSYGLDGSKAYNIIFAPDEFTQDGVTQTLNSYFGYDTGLKYYDKNTQHETISETNKFQVTGSYYADPSAGAMASQFVVVHSDGEKGTDKGSDASRWDKKYIVEPELTEEQKESDKYLWVFTGNDPYNLQVHNQSDPSKYIYRNGDRGGYTVGLTLGTTTNTQRGTFMLMGRGTGDATRYNLMAPGNMTGGNAPYSFQYIGRSYHSNVHRNARRGVVLQGFHEWGWSYQYYEQLVSVKLVPQKLCKVTYVVMNKSSHEAIRYKVEQTSGMAPNLPAAVRSPYAKDFRYWTDEACTSPAGEITADAVIYVTYEVDNEALTAAGIALDGATPYNIRANRQYFHNNADALLGELSPSNLDDTEYEWYLGGNDPYDVRIGSKARAGKYIERAAYDNTASLSGLGTLLTHSAGHDVPAFILMNGRPGSFELMAATAEKTDAAAALPAEIKNRLSYLGYDGGPALLGVGGDDANPVYQSGMNALQIVLRRPVSKTTYHIMNLSGAEAVQYAEHQSAGSKPSVPEAIRSPFATGWQYWSDAAMTTPLNAVPETSADVYVSYVYDDATASVLQLDGQRFYNMQAAGRYLAEADGAIDVSAAALDTDEAVSTDNLWAFDGTTGGHGIDPYDLRLVNKMSGEIYAGAPMTYGVDTETTMHMSDGEEDNFRSAFFLAASPTGEGLYEMVLASGAGITDNILAAVNCHDGETLHLNRTSDLQHGASALAVKMTSPLSRYIYKVKDKSGRIAIQAVGEGTAGEAPEIPDVIKSPLVKTYYYDTETLPYSNGTAVITVTYDVDESKLYAPNLYGSVFYNLRIGGNGFVKTGDGDAVALESSTAENKATALDGTPEAGDTYVWTPSARIGETDAIDPYALTLKHSNGNILSAASAAGGANELTLKTSPDTYNRFMLLEGMMDSYELMAATGETLPLGQYAYLGKSGSGAYLVNGQAYTHDKGNISVELVSFKYDYTYVVVNRSMLEAVRIVKKQDGGNRVMLPDELRSPLIPDENYHYYLADAFSTIGTAEDGFIGTYADRGKAESKFVEAGGTRTEQTELPYSPQTYYVQYDAYEPQGDGLILDGTVKYNIANYDGSNYGFLRANNIQDNTQSMSNQTADIEGAYIKDNLALWTLTGNDPYDIVIVNQANTNKKLTTWWATSGANPGGIEVWKEDRSNWNGHDFIPQRWAVLRHEDGGYRLMSLVPVKYEPTSDGEAAYSVISTRWSTGNVTTADQGMSIRFIPATLHNYRFHLTTKVDGRNLTVTTSEVCRSPFRLPEVLERQYCDYTVKYYVLNDGDNATRQPVPQGTDGAEEKTLSLSTGQFPYFQYVDGLADNDPGKIVDIYVDYTVRPHFIQENGVDKTDAQGNKIVNPDGIPFRLMAVKPETVHFLLNNMPEGVFDLSTYDKRTESLAAYGLDGRRCDYLFFLVMKTDNDFSNANGQYFLRREDSGRISMLENKFAPHYRDADNYRNWTYSRCAEAYRESDHSVFEEKKWLWAFAGDPYDLYVFNVNSVVEETYDAIREQTTMVATHRDHLTTYTTQSNTSGTVKEHAVSTLAYSDPASSFYRWGLAKGRGKNADNTFSFITSEFTGTDPNYTDPTMPAEDSQPLYWRMDKSKVDGKTQVLLQPHTADTTALDYNILPLAYEPVKYENLRFVLKRSDEVETYKTTYHNTSVANVKVYTDNDPSKEVVENPTPQQQAAAQQAQMKFIDALPSGTVRMYSSVAERQYVQGDRITIDDFPVELRRQFCAYNLYKDDYFTPAGTEGYFVVYGPEQGEVQTDNKGNIIYNEQGKAMFNYYAVDPETGEAVYVAPGVRRGAPPQTIYVEYTVNTDIFLKEQPTRAQVDDMLANNDHVYFMDFADPNKMKGKEMAYNTGHHAYYDETATFQSQIRDLYEGLAAEKRVWNGSEFVDDTEQKFNYCRYKTTENRMETVPEDLKWYFVGDPYKTQVYCTKDNFNQTSVTVNGVVKDPGTVPSNLCRFNPVETNFQFVVDCVHFRTPDESLIDERAKLTYTDTDGTDVEVDNPNYGKPYFPNFYWEMVPTTTGNDKAFALRFRADNPVLGYRDVFYYLAHDGIKRTYKEARRENPKAYGINLSYDEDNKMILTGEYTGYHASNDANCAITLMQPTKIYFTAYKENYESEPVVREELSEYYGMGETVTEVPRHLQRKFVQYGNLEYQKNNSADWNASSGFPFTLSDDNYYNLEYCAHEDAVLLKHELRGKTARASFKFRVTYTVDDLTSNGEHIFTTPADFANPDRKPQWLDVDVNRNNWLYYDKTHMNGDRIECDTTRTSKYPTTAQSSAMSGWDTGIKGLHWAFVGDPYSFTAVNRRRWEDNGQPRRAAAGANFWLGTDYETNTAGDKRNFTKLGDTDVSRDYNVDNDANGNTAWSLMMCKTGGAADYFMRTASLKTATVSELVGDYTNSDARNMTNHYARLVREDFTKQGDPATQSSFTLADFSLKTKTQDIQKVEVRTAVAEDDDGADNDCFDANVRIYDKDGNLKATLKHVEVTYGDVFASLPYTLRRYGCNYNDCYQLVYNGYTGAANDATAVAAFNSAVSERLQSLGNFTGTGNAESFVTQKQKDAKFSDASIDMTKLIRDVDGRRYIEIAYVYSVDEAVAPFFTSLNDARQDEYTWTNAYYQWEQEYKGTNLRVVELVDVFDHYVYNADGHIVDEVYRKEERVTYPQGNSYSTPMDGWLNSHAGNTPAYGDERTQSEDNRQKWSLVGDPYSFEMTNYAQYLDNSSSALYASADADDGTQVNASNTQKSHWAIVLGDVKTTLKDGKRVTVTDDNGDPVRLYYLALIDDDESSATYGMALKYVTFDRARDNKDLKSADQYLYLDGGALLTSDPTGNLYDAEGVKGFNLADLLSYANMVVYHLVMPHRHSLDYADTWPDATEEERDKRDMDRMVIDRHLAEWMKYKHPDYMADAATVTIDGTGYTWKSDNFLAGKVSSGTGAVTKGSPFKDRMESGAKTVITGWLKDATLRDILTDSIPDYTATNVAIGNKLTVPWYMKRQHCRYTLYQRDVLKSLTLNGTNEYPKGSGQYPLNYAYLKNAAGQYVDREGNVVDEEHRIQLFLDDGRPAYEIKWVSVVDYWTAGEDAEKTARVKAAAAQTGRELSKLTKEIHKDRMVVIDVVYETDDDNFRFANDGRETKAWYSMMTLNDDNGLIRYSYKDGVGAVRDRSVHATNDVLWAPEGDPYGFVVRNRYATVNGTGWDKVALTTEAAAYNAETNDDVTSTDAFNEYKVKQDLQKEHNAVFEMMGGMSDRSFLMHPTAERLSTADEAFAGSYVKFNTETHRAALAYVSDAKHTANTDRDANWRLTVTPEQLLPYFDRAGYVGGLKPEVAGSFTNRGYYGTLNGWRTAYRSNPDVMDFTTVEAIRNLVYDGTFANAAGTWPQQFTATNLVPVGNGFYRILAYSRQALDHDDAGIMGTIYNGVQGPRYISGYRHLSEARKKNFSTNGALPLHCYETDEAHATMKTFGAFTKLAANLSATDTDGTRALDAHPALRGNIEVLPVEYDPSGIFRFESTGTYGRYNIATQGMSLKGTAGAGEAGVTKLSYETPDDWRLMDIGGGVVTMQRLTTADDSEPNVASNMQTGYLSIDPAHRYSVTVHTANELAVTGDSYAAWSKDGADYAVQTTKWMLQPVGVQTEWPYNELPLSVRVNAGGQKPNPEDGSGLVGEENKDNHYYASLCVPFDTRLEKTVDGAFTATVQAAPHTIRLSSVSQLNNMGNPQFIPAGWPVILRTAAPLRQSSSVKDDGTAVASDPHVNLYLPNFEPTRIPENRSKLTLFGTCLEQELPDDSITVIKGKLATATGKAIDSWGAKPDVMVFGLPFKEGASDKRETAGASDYYAYVAGDAVGFYTNENWKRDNGATSATAKTANDATLETSFLATARNATYYQRSNKYVYHNKVFYLHDYTGSVLLAPDGASSDKITPARQAFAALFEETDIRELEEEADDPQPQAKDVRWGVFDLAGRQLRTREAVLNGTWRRHLPPGMYIVNGRKLLIK